MAPLTHVDCNHLTVRNNAEHFEKLSLERCKGRQNERILIEIESIIDYIEDPRDAVYQPMVIRTSVGKKIDSPFGSLDFSASRHGIAVTRSSFVEEIGIIQEAPIFK
jgi:hypothetical protein